MTSKSNDILFDRNAFKSDMDFKLTCNTILKHEKATFVQREKARQAFNLAFEKGFSQVPNYIRSDIVKISKVLYWG